MKMSDLPSSNERSCVFLFFFFFLYSLHIVCVYCYSLWPCGRGEVTKGGSSCVNPQSRRGVPTPGFVASLSSIFDEGVPKLYIYIYINRGMSCNFHQWLAGYILRGFHSFSLSSPFLIFSFFFSFFLQLRVELEEDVRVDGRDVIDALCVNQLDTIATKYSVPHSHDSSSFY